MNEAINKEPADVVAVLQTKLDLIELTTQMTTLADRRDWERLEHIFGPEVRVDYTALAGGSPASVKSTDLVAGWKVSLGSLDATQHMISNHEAEVDGNSAVVHAYFQATHVCEKVKDGSLWVLGGKYLFQCTKIDDVWRISGVTMTPIWQTGNPHLLEQAQQIGDD